MPHLRRRWSHPHDREQHVLSGRRSEDRGFHDVTKTKPSHHHPAAQQKAAKKTWPETHKGAELANEVKATDLPEEQKVKLIQSILDYENRKGEITKTFSRLLRKQLPKPD